jgi:hypothetical protein
MTHPIDIVYVDGSNVSKSAVRGFVKEKTQVSVGNADDVRNADWSGQFGGLYVRSLNASFFIDTDDIQADDGVNVIIDDAGNHWLRQAVTVSETELPVTASGNVTLDDDETADLIFINNTSGGAIDVFLPDAGVRTKAITIIDDGENAGTHNISVKPKAASGQTIKGGSVHVIDSDGGSIRLTPKSDGTKYV